MWFFAGGKAGGKGVASFPGWKSMIKKGCPFLQNSGRFCENPGDFCFVEFLAWSFWGIFRCRGFGGVAKMGLLWSCLVMGGGGGDGKTCRRAQGGGTHRFKIGSNGVRGLGGRLF